MLLAHIRWECWLSTLMPKTWASFSSNWRFARPNPEIW
jgi:hypothetical protein